MTLLIMTTVLFVGQAPPQVPVPYPFARTRLYRWLETIGWDKESVVARSHFTGILAEWPGRVGKTDRVPTKDDILANTERLSTLVTQLHPGIIVAIGAIAAQAVLSLEAAPQLVSVVGQLYEVIPFGVGTQTYSVVVLPHPSGLSTWVYQPGNQALLDRSLQPLKKYL
jgi:uracil-DNA glycosylase